MEFFPIIATGLASLTLATPALAHHRPQAHSTRHHHCYTHVCRRNDLRWWEKRHPREAREFVSEDSRSGVIVNFYIRRGLTRAQAAGIAGNTMQESKNDPGAEGGGLVQGQGGRTCCGSLTDQLWSVWGELRGPYSGVLFSLRRARSPEDAARVFCFGFEQPGIPAIENREQYAREAAHA